MKKYIFSLLALLVVMTIDLYGQEHSEYKVQTIEGIEYYLYPVQPSEGLYRISVNFGVSQDEIIKANPEVKDGLKSGQVLLIPKKPASGRPRAASNAEKTATRTPPPVDLIAASFGGSTTTQQAPAAPKQETYIASHANTNKEPHFYYRKVQKKETLYSLSKEYGVKQEDIIKYNPDVAGGLREGVVLRVPKAEDIYPQKMEEKLQEDNSVTYLIHKVEPKETLYSISKQYNVKIDDIHKINPDLEVLSIGQDLKIPYYTGLTTTEIVDGKQETFLDWDKILERADTAQTQQIPVKIAFMLPFMLDNGYDPAVSRFVEFYAGALKAIYEAQETNTSSTEVYTYDSGKSQESLADVLAKHPELKDMDLIIGPAYGSQVGLASQFAKDNRVKTLIPFFSKIAGIESNPYIFQFNTINSTVELNFLEEMFNSKFKNMNYIFADLENISPTDEGPAISSHIKTFLDAQGSSYKTLSLSYPQTSMFDSVMVYNKKNLIIFNTERFASVEPYFESLNRTDQRYDIVMLERYAWKNQEIYRPIGLYIAPFKPEYQMKLNSYEDDFFTLFGWNATSRHPRYDLWGYDLTRYFIELLNNRETDIMSQLELKPYKEGIQSEIKFVRQDLNSGFINQQLYMGESQVK